MFGDAALGAGEKLRVVTGWVTLRFGVNDLPDETYDRPPKEPELNECAPAVPAPRGAKLAPPEACGMAWATGAAAWPAGAPPPRFPPPSLSSRAIIG